MRLGGPVYRFDVADPASWVAAHRAKGYRAAFCPVGPDADPGLVDDLARAAAAADLVVAEVGAWSNPLSPDAAIRDAALARCRGGLALAERIGARCCVNIAGSRGAKWDGPCAADLTDGTFDLIVASVREIVDAVGPRRTRYCLETMPWMYPDSPEAYARLLEAIDRPEAVGVHLDPVNLIHSPARCFASARLLRDCFRILGPRIRSCHAKDIRLGDRLTVHLDEVRPGAGSLDYHTYLELLAQLDRDTPLMLEHLPDEEEYDRAADHLRGVARQVGVEL